MAQKIITKNEEIVFKDYHLVEPENLISLSDAYTEKVPEIREFLQNNLQKTVEILLCRINSNGSFNRKLISGIVKTVDDSRFTLLTAEDFHSKYDNLITLTVRFENVLGDVPLLPHQSAIHPYEIESSKQFSDYFQIFIPKMMTLMKSCIGTTHAATVYYHYSKTQPLHRNGNYKVECSILEVNRSNFKYDHARTISFIDKEHSYVNIVPNRDVDRYIAPDRFIKKVTVHFGDTHHINPHDDE